MKKYLYNITMVAIVATIAISLTSCDKNDDDIWGSGNNNGTNNKKTIDDYTFSLNGETYYYGYYPLGIGELETRNTFNLHKNYWDAEKDYCTFEIDAFDTRILSLKERTDKEGNIVIDNKWNYAVQGTIDFEKFDPKTISKGQILTTRTSGDYEGRRQRIYIDPYGGSGSSTRWYYRSPYNGGVIKFVSYTYDIFQGVEVNKIITLEFINVTFEADNRYYYGSSAFEANTITINGILTFKG